jgi:hypothetical protein
MTVTMPIIFVIAAGFMLLLIIFLIALVFRELSENKRLREERAREPMTPVKAPMQDRQASVAASVGAYSYDSIVMDEVLGEKVIDELKRSLRMTEEMYQKLTERFKDDRDRRIELANDWLNYLEALDSIKQSRIDYRMNNGDGESLARERDSSRIKLEIENKFKGLQQPGVVPPMVG